MPQCLIQNSFFSVFLQQRLKLQLCYLPQCPYKSWFLIILATSCQLEQICSSPEFYSENGLLMITSHFIQQTHMLKRIIYSMSFTYPCPRKLREVMKMSMIERQSTTKIEEIWKEYHSGRINNISAVLTKEKYNYFFQRANSAPFFLLPVFRKGGHFKLITQWQKDCFLGTFLEDFKRRGHNAHPYIVFTFFTELLFQKGIVLVRGDVINNTLTKPEAEKLWSMLEVSYCHSANFQYVHNFNNNTQEFNEKQYNDAYGISN